MAATNRDARRRRRILEGGQDRLALITGRKPHLSSSDTTNDLDSSQSPHHLRSNLFSDQPSAIQNEEGKPPDSAYSTRDQAPKFTQSDPLNGRAGDQAAKFSQSDPLIGRSSEESFVRKPESMTEPSRASATEYSNRGESSSAVPKAVLIASEAVMQLAQRIPISHLTSQQVAIAVAETENDRMLCALIVAILVILSWVGFPIVSSFIFRWIILFRPLILLLMANLALIIRRLLPENHKNLARGVKDEGKPLLGDGYAWAEEAGRALELGLMLQNVMSALLMDCSVYATIIVFGLSLFG